MASQDQANPHGDEEGNHPTAGIGQPAKPCSAFIPCQCDQRTEGDAIKMTDGPVMGRRAAEVRRQDDPDAEQDRRANGVNGNSLQCGAATEPYDQRPHQVILLFNRQRPTHAQPLVLSHPGRFGEVGHVKPIRPERTPHTASGRATSPGLGPTG